MQATERIATGILGKVGASTRSAGLTGMLRIQRAPWLRILVEGALLAGFLLATSLLVMGR